MHISTIFFSYLLWCSGSWIVTAQTSCPIVQDALFLGAFQSRQHGLSGCVYANGGRRLEVRNMTYDGLGPAGYFWADTRKTPSKNGFRLLDKTSCGQTPLPRIDRTNNIQPIPVEFPNGLSLANISGGSIAVWCEEFQANFGEVYIDPTILDKLDSLPQPPLSSCDASKGEMNMTSSFAQTPPMYNCEPLTSNFQVRWRVNGTTVLFELLAIIDKNVYMAFGVSGKDDQPWMLGGDPVVADYFQGKPRARDFYLRDRAQCSVGTGVCPEGFDNITRDDVITGSVTGQQVDGLTLIRYSRPATTNDVGDRPIPIQPGLLTTVIWALGPIDPDSGNPFFHAIGYSKQLIQFDFGREPRNNCALLTPKKSVGDDTKPLRPFLRPVLTNTTEFRAVIGPSGGRRGYAAISSGRTAWGIAWYINDILVPVIEMRRGQTYRFYVSGGDDPTSSSEYHPFYLTTSIRGGYVQRTSAEQAQETILGGIQRNTTGFQPTALAPLCLYLETESSADSAPAGFGTYFRTLDTKSKCPQDSRSRNASLIFTPDKNTPNLIYYQCVEHANLGWQIYVIDQDAPSILDVDCGNFHSSPLQLSEDLTFHAIINPNNGTITIELVLNRIAWLALAFTDGTPSMLGAQAVIGLPNLPNTTQRNPAKYQLNLRELAGIVPMPESQQTLIDASVTQADSQTILKFTRRLIEPKEHPIFTDLPNTFLFAHGSSNTLGFHADFGSFQLVPNQCAVRIAGVLQNDYALNQQGSPVVVDNAKLHRNAWVAHGALAATAWAILVPLAVGASCIRKLLKRWGLSNSAWFQIHRALNVLAFILTLIAFAIATSTTQESTPAGMTSHYCCITHRQAGLAIFVLTFLQVSFGILRPHLQPTPPPESVQKGTVPMELLNDEIHEPMDMEGELGEKHSSLAAGEKSLARMIWEFGHRLLGASLIGLAWWQVQDGLGLFAEKFGEENWSYVFWIVVSCIVAPIIGLAVYQRIKM